MKSTILSLLPLAGLAIAESACSRQTITHTEYEQVYETVNAADIGVDASTTSGVCSRSTVTTTTYEKVYVTVTAEASEEAASTSTSTEYTTTTVTIRPSGVPAISTAHALPTAPRWTNSSVGASKPFHPTVTYTPPQLTYSDDFTLVSQSEAPKPSETASAAASPMSNVVQKSEVASAGSNKGKATYYGGNVDGGMCSFTGYTIPSGLYGTALSDSNWAGAGNCGACVEVTGPAGNKITAMVVDQCPGCGPNHLDLFPTAFSKLDNPNKGIIDVSWDIVPCGITTPIVLKNKEGTSKYWFSMQVMNSNVVVSKLEVSTDGGKSWKSTTRKEYNFFENPSGFGTDTVDVKVTSSTGSSIIVKDVSIQAQSTKTAGSNFA
ncbi:hypothetical protein ACN47E_003337 [Coniothyrium glycines]